MGTTSLNQKRKKNTFGTFKTSIGINKNSMEQVETNNYNQQLERIPKNQNIRENEVRKGQKMIFFEG